MTSTREAAARSKTSRRELELSIDATLAEARAELASTLRAGGVGIACVAGPRGRPALVLGPEPLAASCLLLPDLAAFAAEYVGRGRVVAAVPRRTALFVFAAGDAAYHREALLAFARGDGASSDGLADGLFALEADGPWPLGGDDDDA